MHPESLQDGSHIYKPDREVRHAERPGFRINELEYGPGKGVPWHYHSSIQDTFYVLAGRISVSVRDPEEEFILNPGETCSVGPMRPHQVKDVGDDNAIFFVLQGVGQYDYVPID